MWLENARVGDDQYIFIKPCAEYEINLSRIMRLGLGAGYTLTYHAGVDARSDIVLELVELDRFGFTCMDGGTVEVSFRARCNPDASVIGRLCGVMQSEISCTLIPPPGGEVAGDDD